MGSDRTDDSEECGLGCPTVTARFNECHRGSASAAEAEPTAGRRHAPGRQGASRAGRASARTKSSSVA
jgi:hypothetical protein